MTAETPVGHRLQMGYDENPGITPAAQLAAVMVFPTLAAITVMALALATTPIRAETVNLPELGEDSAAVISPYQERRIGEQAMRQIRRSLSFVEDPELEQYIQDLGQKLLAHADRRGLDFQFFLIDNSSINAFALPGGFVGVHTGLLLASRNESEVAAALAHEIAHVTQRHWPRMVAEGQRQAGITLAALLASLVIVASGQEGGEAAMVLATAVSADNQLRFTRIFEEEADRIGIRFLAASQFDARAMATFFERMQQANRINESDLPEFLRTHPVTSRRIAEARDNATRFSQQQNPDSDDYYHVHAKIRAVYSSNTRETVNQFRQNLASGKYRSADAERYGYALALLKAKQYRQARTQIQRLRQRHPNRLRYQLAHAEIEMAAANYKKALTLYAGAAKKHPTAPHVVRRYATALLQTGQAKQAMTVLKPALRNRPKDPILNKMLATAAGEIGELVEAHRALAEYYFLNGDRQAAIDQLQIAARNNKGDFYASNAIEARMKEIQAAIAADAGTK